MFIHLVNDSITPPAREQHVAVEVGGNILLFGGKQRLFPRDQYNNIIVADHSDRIFGDFWMLQVQRSKPFALSWSADIPANQMAIPQDRRLFAGLEGKNNSLPDIGDGINARQGMCIQKVVVKVRVYILYYIH